MYQIFWAGEARATCEHWHDAMRVINALDTPAFIRDPEDGAIIGINQCLTENISIDMLGLSVRTYNILKRNNCETLADVLHNWELSKMRNMGKKSMEELRRWALALERPLWSDQLEAVEAMKLGMHMAAELNGVDLGLLEQMQSYNDFNGQVNFCRQYDCEIPMDYMAARVAETLKSIRANATI